MRLALLVLLFVAMPLASATPPEPPPQRYGVALVRAPAAGEWGEIRGEFWHEDGGTASEKLTLHIPDWVAVAESPEWDAQAPAGGKATHTWMVRPTREGLWSAKLGWGPDLVAWASSTDGGGYDQIPRVLDVERRVEVVGDGRVRVTTKATPSGAWVNGTIDAWLRPTGDGYDGSQDAYDGPLRTIELSVTVAPNATGRVSVQDWFAPILHFDGPAADTPHRVQLQSDVHVYELSGRDVREVDTYTTILPAEPATTKTPSARDVPAPWAALSTLAAVLAALRSHPRVRSTDRDPSPRS